MSGTSGDGDGSDPARLDLGAMRRDYGRGDDAPGLSEGDLAADWLAQFRRWFDDAVAAGLPEPNAMVVATARAEGRPERPHGAAEGRRRAGLRVLHQLHVAQGRRAGREPVRQPGLSVVPDEPPGRRLRSRGQGGARGIGGILRHPAARLAARRLGEPAVAGRGGSRGARRRASAKRSSGSPTSPEVPVPPHWGGLRAAPGDGGVLAGPDEPAARPAALPPRRAAADDGRRPGG